MKNVPIKFRGKDIISGEYVYGDYVTRSEGCAIRVRENDKLFDMHEYEIAVKPESVAQLVGYDANGAEVYEGDFVKVGNDVVKVFWDNQHTCFAVKWKNGLEDSYGSVFNHYNDKPYLVKGNDND